MQSFTPVIEDTKLSSVKNFDLIREVPPIQLVLTNHVAQIILTWMGVIFSKKPVFVVDHNTDLWQATRSMLTKLSSSSLQNLPCKSCTTEIVMVECWFIGEAPLYRKNKRTYVGKLPT